MKCIACSYGHAFVYNLNAQLLLSHFITDLVKRVVGDFGTLVDVSNSLDIWKVTFVLRQ